MLQQRTIEPCAKGIGDVLTWICACSGLGEPVRLVTRHTAWVNLFHNFSAVEADPTAIKLDTWQKEMANRGGIPRHQSYADLLGCKPAMPSIINPISDWAERYRGHILLFPFSQWEGRQWPLIQWVHLSRRLEQLGEQVVALAPSGHMLSLLNFTKKKVGLSPAKLFDAVRCCKLVIGNDSAPPHMAGVAGVRAIAICGPCNGWNSFSFYPTVRWIQGKLPCDCCYWQTADYQPVCSTHCADLASIHFSEIVDMVYSKRIPLL